MTIFSFFHNFFTIFFFDNFFSQKCFFNFFKKYFFFWHFVFLHFFFWKNCFYNFLTFFTIFFKQFFAFFFKIKWHLFFLQFCFWKNFWHFFLNFFKIFLHFYIFYNFYYQSNVCWSELFLVRHVWVSVLRQGNWGSEFSCAPRSVSVLQRAFLCLPCPVFVRVSPLRYLSCTHKWCPSCSECGPNVSVRRIEASFRKRGNSLSGNPWLRHPILFKDAESFRVRGLCIYLSEGIKKKIPFREWRAIRFRESLRRD